MSARDDYFLSDRDLSEDGMLAVMCAEIDRLRARVAELEDIPPHPYFLAWAKVDKLPIIIKHDGRWIHVGPEPPEAP